MRNMHLAAYCGVNCFTFTSPTPLLTPLLYSVGAGEFGLYILSLNLCNVLFIEFIVV